MALGLGFTIENVGDVLGSGIRAYGFGSRAPRCSKGCRSFAGVAQGPRA